MINIKVEYMKTIQKAQHQWHSMQYKFFLKMHDNYKQLPGQL